MGEVAWFYYRSEVVTSIIRCINMEGVFSSLESHIPAGLKAAEINSFNSEAACGILCEEKEACPRLKGRMPTDIEPAGECG